MTKMTQSPIKYYYPGIFLLLMVILTSCKEKTPKEKLIRELLEVDIEFSRRSAESGANMAFLEYIDEECVLLRPNKHPILGKEKIAEMFSRPDTSFSLTWTPLFADVSNSGDLGYTYGTYLINMDSPEGERVKKEGTYAVIWKKNKDGEWKFVLDTGNQGLGQAVE